MAILYALKTGNWSDTTVWNTGSLPTSADDVYANNFTVTINQSITVSSLNTLSTTGVNAGGGFSVTLAGLTINVTNIRAGTTACLNISSTGTTTVNANTLGGSTGNAWAVALLVAGTLNFSGIITGGSTTNTSGLRNSSTGTINATGQTNGGDGTGTGLENISTGTINFTGNCFGGKSATGYGVLNSNTGTINITGNCGGTSGIWGTTTAGISVNQGNSLGTITINGNVFGGYNSSATGVQNAGVGTVNINGNVYHGIGSSGAVNSTTGTLRVTRAIANLYIVSVSAVSGSAFNGNTIVREIEFGGLGQWPLGGFVKFQNNDTNFLKIVKENSTFVVLSDPLNLNNILPTESDVRQGTVYNSRTGTLVLPSVSNVRKNIHVGSLIGTATFTSQELTTAITTALGNKLITP